ncbi:RCC1 and BTB domain-containing protein 1-like isoform X1 [Vespa mandarinia]|uniref:RCC1 and BTB domain-containing protein 1-like isoform X1 n=2 Tax=Vespa mandarinia TaxID=7446 RepID=UPI00161ED9BB|nr:RCC1 and BTB domain-containing protein 1-like isoform X1 [Vespa mandarinia]XP_046823340.1 RCC1 and BTB domain-containing protein 1-like isoform X1 [Vespa crabro]
MSSFDLKNWPIFSLLESKFIASIQMVVVYGNLGNEALIVTKDDMVYGLGCNITGCLGTGDAHSTLHPKKVEALCEKGIKTFAYGSGPHVLALTDKGEVYSWGHNGFCELGNGSSNHGLTPTPVGMPLSEKVVIDIACGSHHSLALTDEGEVYAWGQNNCGQVGSGISSNQGAPRKINSSLTGKKVVSITCGQTYSMAVTNNGEIYGWGHNGVGQLGNGTYTNQLNPCKVTGLIGIVIEKVACGYAHTLALSDEGVLYVWGSNSYGQLGLGNKTNACVPMKLSVPEMGRVSDIAALHYNHISVAIGEGHKVFMWGQCRGQSITVPTPTLLAHLHDALACYASPSVMHRPLFLYAAEEMNIVDCLKQAFDDSTTSDLIIQVQARPIYVHKAVLKIRCQYFRTMFQECWMENNQSVLHHDQFSHDVFKSFLKYLYTDEVDLPPENALELLDLANVYCETQLKRRCVQIIKQGITVLNVAYLYRTAMNYNIQELEEFCFKFALNHMTAVIQTSNFGTLDEETVKTFIIKAARAGAFKT